MVYLFVLRRLAGKCTEIYNACRTIVRLIKPLVCDVFPAVVVCARSLLLWSIKSHNVDLSVFCLLLYMWLKPWNIPSEQLSSSTLEKGCSICPWKFSEIRPGIFGRMVSAPDFRKLSKETMIRTMCPRFESSGIFIVEWKVSLVSELVVVCFSENSICHWKFQEISQTRRFDRMERVPDHVLFFLFRTWLAEIKVYSVCWHWLYQE